MKFDPSKAFPYPVLRPGSDDYGSGTFSAAVDVEVQGDTVDFTVEFSLACAPILKLIERGDACYTAVVSCRDTFCSRTQQTFSPLLKMSLETIQIHGNVEINKYILAVRDTCVEAGAVHADFGAGPVQYQSGTVIAQDVPSIMTFGRECFASVTSVIYLVKDETLEYGEWTVRTESDHLKIAVNPHVKDILDRARSDTAKRAVLLNSVYLPAVASAIEILRDDESLAYTWALVFRHKLDDLGLKLHGGATAAETAAALLRKPLIRLIETVLDAGEAG